MNRFLSTPLRREFFYLILLPFLLWTACFWSCIFGPLPEDIGTASYGEKTVFLMTNLFRGGYPLWDPTYFDGFPFEFFLRRIGDGNPFYIFVGLAKLCGASGIHAYRFFTMIYFFMGAVGFWLICRYFLRHRLACIGAYWMFLFSGWGSRAFSDYIILLFVPLVWFFYFVIAFLKERKKHQFLGIALTAAISMTTYVPSFFLTVVVFFFVSFLVFFVEKIQKMFQVTVDFLRKNAVFAVLCGLFFAGAIAPEIQFFSESKRGEFVMPGRNIGSEEKSSVSVKMDQTKVGDLMSQGYFYRVFEDHKNLVLLDFFVPYMFFLVCIISLINPLTRQTVFLAVNALFFAIVSVSDTSRIYAFLYQNIFFFKYMRMMSFLFWTAAFPLAIFFAMRQLDIFLDNYERKRSVYLYVFVVVAHLLFGAWALSRGGVAWTSWVAVLASLIFFLGVISGRYGSKVFLGILAVGIMVQPMEMISYMVKNDAPSQEALTRAYPVLDGKFKFKRRVLSEQASQDQSVLRPEGGIYCGTKWYQELSLTVPASIKDAFTANALYLMDSTQIYDDVSREFFLVLGQKWHQRKNVVFLSRDTAKPQDVRVSTGGGSFEIIDDSTKSVKVVRFTPTTLELTTTFDRPRFLLWTDNYHSGWHVFINGAEVKLLRADHAFKGVWVPAGESRVFFRFGTPWVHAWRYFIWFSYLAALAGVIFLAVLERSRPDAEKVAP
jgi:hypothetical protein